jgi:hypothetical protein
MTVTTDALIPALENTRQAHAAVIDRFRSDLAITPAGPHRYTLERHVADARVQITRIDGHVRELRPRRLVQDTAETARAIAESAVRTARTPLEIGAMIAGGILRGSWEADERRLLMNAQDEYMITARALATCRAGESIAALAQDDEAQALLGSLRRQDEQLLQTLEYSVDEQARALATATAENGRARDGRGLTGAAGRAVRTAVDQLREAARTGGERARRAVVGGTGQWPSLTRMTEQGRGAAATEETLPIRGYEQLAVTDITQRLPSLSQSDLNVLEGYELAHAARAGVLNAIDGLRGTLPWPDFDTMEHSEIIARLRAADPLLARQALDYEQRHRQRQDVIAAARQRTRATV